MQHNSHDTKKIIKAIRDRMDEQGISVYQLVKDTGLPKQTVYDLINKNTLQKHVDYLTAITSALGLDITIKPKKQK